MFVLIVRLLLRVGIDRYLLLNHIVVRSRHNAQRHIWHSAQKESVESTDSAQVSQLVHHSLYLEDLGGHPRAETEQQHLHLGLAV